MSQGGSVGRRNWKTGESWFVKPLSLDPKLLLRFNWNSAMAQDPFDKKTIYFGSQFVHKTTDKGITWQNISPDITTNDITRIAAFQNTGGLTLDITGAETYCTVLTIAPSPKQQGVIWAGTDDGNVQLTRDGGKNWENFRGKIPGMPVGCWIPQIVASRHNAGEAFVVANDYRRGDFKAYIFRTSDFGKSWSRMVDDNKVNGYALCVIQDPVEPNLIFAGTEHGLWVSLDNGSSFEQWKNGYPSVSTYDLAIQEREADLAIASFGRALWVLDDIRPLRTLASSKGTGLTQTIKVFPAPDAYQAQYRQATGYDWSVYGLWDADNRRRGAEISYYVNRQRPATADTANRQPSNTTTTTTTPTTTTAPQQGGGQQGGGQRGGGRFPGTTVGTRGDTAVVRIYNTENSLIRTLRWGVDSGFNRNYWGMEEKGFRQPGSPKPSPNAQEPGGFQVLPGTYKVVITYARASDSTFVTIKDDPRIGNRNEVKIAQRNVYDRLRKTVDKLTEGMDRLTEAEEVCSKINTEIRGLEGKDIDSLRRETTRMQEEIKSIRDFIQGKTSDRQGLSRSPFDVTPISLLQSANQSIGSKMVVPGAQVDVMIVNAEKSVGEALQKINTFFEGKWKNYRALVEGTKLNLFKEYKPIE